MCLRTIACRLTFSAAVCQAVLLLLLLLLLLLASLAAADASSLLPAVVDFSLQAESALADLCQNNEEGEEEEEVGLCAVGIA